MFNPVLWIYCGFWYAAITLIALLFSGIIGFDAYNIRKSNQAPENSKRVAFVIAAVVFVLVFVVACGLFASLARGPIAL